MPLNSVEERRMAIKGWVYSPYRIRDLMHGILGNWDLPGKDHIHLKIYDDTIITKESLLYYSHGDDIAENEINPNLNHLLPVHFSSKIWMLEFTVKSEEITLLNPRLLIVLCSGIFISILLFFLTISLFRSRLNLKQINILNTQLEKLNVDKDRFISILAHDLKTPFGSVIGFLEILSNDYEKLDSEKVENYINYSHSAAKNAYHLLEDLLKWTQSGKLPYQPEYINVKDICNHILKSLEVNANLKNIKILYLGNNEATVFADSYMLKTILRNLVSNAIKFTNYGGEIMVQADENPENMEISVSDNGIGIMPEDLQKLFDISHVHTTKGTADEKGSGLGLYLTKEFIERHNGTIHVESVFGKGSTFTIFIPVNKTIN
jgi:signal transduction histidine kinase